MAEGSVESGERLLSPAEVAARFLTRVENVRRWVEEGRLRAVPGGRSGFRIPESALEDFRKTAYRRENFNGVDHGLRSWPADNPQSSNLPVPAQNAGEAEAQAPRWPFPHA
jgi:excisionase family DNA binding protein